jgi:AraC family transcriptional regulator
MAYQRTQQFESALLRLETATLQQPLADDWSAEYASSELKIVLPQSGHFMARFDRDAFVYDACTAMTLSPQRGYRIRHTRRQHTRMLVLVIKDAIAVHDCPTLSRRIFIAPTLQWQLLHLCAAAQSGQLEQLQADEQSVFLLDALLRRHGVPEAGAHQNTYVERARQCLAAAPEQALSLAQLAQQAGCSQFHLARAFKCVTGTSAHRYQLNLRLCAALDRLAQGESDLTTLALDCGFSSHSHFSAAFKQIFGATPQHSRAALQHGKAGFR